MYFLDCAFPELSGHSLRLLHGCCTRAPADGVLEGYQTQQSRQCVVPCEGWTFIFGFSLLPLGIMLGSTKPRASDRSQRWSQTSSPLPAVCPFSRL
jgi:hypothetical protein